MMNRFLILCIFLLFSSSYTHAHNKPHPPSPSPVSTPTIAPKPSSSKSDCSTVIFGMMDCLSYLTPGSKDTKPVKSCCTSIEDVLKYNPECICIGLKSSKDMGITLNTTRALDTPKACKLAIAPPNCGITNGDASTPVPSTPSMSPGAVSPSSGTHKTSPSSSKSPKASPTLAESPARSAPSPSISGTNNLSVPTLLLTILVSFGYISAFSN